MNRLVIGLTTIPSRFDRLNVVLDSLHNQTRKPDKIYLYVADYYERFQLKTDFGLLPGFLQNYNLLDVKHGKDYGPISKLFVSLQNELDEDTVIVTCDDDMIYEQEWLSKLEENYDRLHGSAVGYRGRVFGKTLRYAHTGAVVSNGVSKDTCVDIVTALRGWAYKRGFFEDKYIREWERVKVEHPYIFFNDDIWISGNLKKKNINKIVFSGPINSLTQRLRDSLIESSRQKYKTNMHIKLFEQYWRGHA